MILFPRNLGVPSRLALAALTLATACAPTASAQDADTPDRRGSSAATVAGQPSRGAGSGPSVNDDPTAADLPAAIPSDDPSEDRVDPFADEEARPRTGQRAAVRDGDLSTDEPALVRDGVIDVGEPLPPEDGGDPTQIDSREPEEAALFTNPAGTTDALLFQIEDIDPVRTDRRITDLARIEPYDPIGIKIGSFVYFPELEVGGLYQSNLFRRSDAEPDVAAEVRNTSRLVSNWAAHALEVRSTSTLNFHNAFPEENDRAWALEARGRLDIAKRTNLQGQISHDVRQEGRSAIDASVTGDRIDVTTDDASLTFNHRFNRLSIQLRGAVTENDFGATAGAGGAAGASNTDRDTTTTEQAVRASWEFKPTFAVFAEVETNQRDYDVVAVADGLSRTSDGRRYRTGIDFGSASRMLRGEVSLGYGVQSPDAAALNDVEGVLVDANVAWRMTDLTSLLFTARTDLFDTNTAGTAGVVSHQVGVEARHAFRKYLIASAGLTYTNQDYDSVDIEESELRASLGLDYFINREFVLFGRYDHINFESNQIDGDWVSDDVRLGLRWRR